MLKLIVIKRQKKLLINIKEEPNVASIDFDEIQDYTVWDALELFDDDISDVEVIKAEDVL